MDTISLGLVCSKLAGDYWLYKKPNEYLKHKSSFLLIIIGFLKDRRDNLHFTLNKAVKIAVLSLTSLSFAFSSLACDNSQSNVSSNQSFTSSHSKNSSTDEEIVIRMAMTGNPDIDDVIDGFNSSDNGYRIDVVKYDVSDTSDVNSLQRSDFELIQDIIKGEIDIICSQSFYDSAYYEILKGKGALADLYTFMEEDENVNCSTLNQHVLQINELDGKLYSLPTFYGITTLIGKSEYVGTKENWTTDEFIAHWKQMPEGSTICGYTQSENIYRYLLRSNIDTFIDYSSQQVHFDSSEFTKILEFCGGFESNHGLKGERNPNAPEFVSTCYIDGFSSTAGYFQTNSPYTIVGYPSPDGTGSFLRGVDISYSICANISSERQRAAWEFIRIFASYDYQKSHVIIWEENPDYPELSHFSGERGIPINNQVLEETAREIISGKYSDGTYTVEGVQYKANLPTEEDYEGFLVFINQIKRWENENHGMIWSIVNEETSSYFSGEKSLDETVRMIQSRAGLWISEQS